MGKRYPMEIIAAAKAQFLEDHTFSEIALYIGRITGRNTTATLVLKWSRKYGWAEDKEALEAKTMAMVDEQVAELRESVITDTLRAQIAAYRSLRERGLDELRKMEITRPSDAIAMVVKGVKGERELLSNAVTKKFLIDVAVIIKSEVQNRDTQLRIGHRLVELGIKYNLKFNVG